MKKQITPTIKRFLLPTTIILVISTVLTYPAWLLITMLINPIFDHPQLGPQLCSDIRGGKGLCLLGFFLPAFFLSATFVSSLVGISAFMKKSWKQYMKNGLFAGIVSAAVLLTTLPVKQIASLYKNVLFIRTGGAHAQNLVEKYKNELEGTGSLSPEIFNHYKWLLEKSGSNEALGDLYVVLGEKLGGNTKDSAYQEALEHYREALKKRVGDSQGLELKIIEIQRLLKE